MKTWLLGNWGTKLTALVLAVLVYWYLRESGSEDVTLTIPFQVQHPDTVARARAEILTPVGEWLPIGDTIKVTLNGPRGEVQRIVAEDLRCRVVLTRENAATTGKAERTFDLTSLSLVGLRAGGFETQFQPSNRVRLTWTPYVPTNMRIATDPLSRILQGQATGMRPVRVTASPESVQVLVPWEYDHTELIAPPAEPGRLPRIFPQPVSVAGRLASFDAPGQLHHELERAGVRLAEGQSFTLRVELEPEPASRRFQAAIGDMLHPRTFAVGSWQVVPADDRLEVEVEGPKRLVDGLNQDLVRVHLVLTSAPPAERHLVERFFIELPEGFRDLRARVVENPPHVAVEFLRSP